MNYFDQSQTRDEWEATIPAGEKTTFTETCDYFFLDVIDVVAEGGAPTKLKVKLNKKRNFATCRGGQSQQGVPERGDIRTLEFWNPSGSAVFVRVIYGNGQCNFSSNVTIQNASLDISDESIDAIVTPLTAVEEAECEEESVTHSDGIKTFSGMSGVTIFNTGPNVIEYKKASGATWKQLAVGDNTGWTVCGKFQILKPLQVRCPTVGGKADVVFVGGAMT